MTALPSRSSASTLELSWCVAQLGAAPDDGSLLTELINWCRRTLPPGTWRFSPRAGRADTSELAQWAFLDRTYAEAFVAEASRRLGELGEFRIYQQLARPAKQ